MNEHRGLWCGKRVDDGEWVLGCLIRSSSKAMIFVVDDKTNRISGTDVDLSTLGECTGLRDKNGKLIFEGDILEFPEHNERDVVMWDDEFSGFFLTDIDPNYSGVANLCDATKDGVIIGNAHDNPELIPKGADELYGKENKL